MVAFGRQTYYACRQFGSRGIVQISVQISVQIGHKKQYERERKGAVIGQGQKTPTQGTAQFDLYFGLLP